MNGGLSVSLQIMRVLLIGATPVLLLAACQSARAT